MRLLVPFGTRPEIVKLAPVVAALRDAGHDVHTIATGQHDDPRLADRFFEDLGLVPDERWTLPRPEAERVGTLLTRAFEALSRRPVDAVVLLGDTYTVPLFGLAARRHEVPVAHLEAGLRSFNERSLEEVNRRAVGAMASLHLAPTPLAARFLSEEGVPATRVHVVGNPITDTLRLHGPRRQAPSERVGVVVTAHRATNVDDPVRLAQVATIVRRLALEVGPVRFPLHPRTRDRLASAGALEELAAAPGVDLCEPLPYPEMLAAIAAARVVVTDSGGLQEEAAWLGVPCVVLRTSTPRWEGVESGIAALTGLDPDRAMAAAVAFNDPDAQARVAAVPCPYGDGRVGPRVAALLSDPAVQAVLALEEPRLDDLRPILAPSEVAAP
jgi:UDP-N-acetylglucosamine 2-epimerase (non-hydrolysing)